MHCPSTKGHIFFNPALCIHPNRDSLLISSVRKCNKKHGDIITTSYQLHTTGIKAISTVGQCDTGSWDIILSAHPFHIKCIYSPSTLGKCHTALSDGGLTSHQYHTKCICSISAPGKCNPRCIRSFFRISDFARFISIRRCIWVKMNHGALILLSHCG